MQHYGENPENAFTGLCVILGIIFIALKKLGVITWTWWWVCSPLITLVAVFIIVMWRTRGHS